MKENNIKISKFQIGDTMTSNVYIVWDQNTKQAVIIDPGFDDQNILDIINDLDLKVEKILLTHGHFDHIGGLQKLLDLTDAEVYISEKDSDFLKDPNLNLSIQAGFPAISIDTPVIKVKNGDKIELLPDLDVTVLETPGHTPGSICFVGDHMIFSGDVLFEGSIGRTDFPGGSIEEMSESLGKLLQFNDNTVILPGHGPATTIARERKYNPFLINA